MPIFHHLIHQSHITSNHSAKTQFRYSSITNRLYICSPFLPYSFRPCPLPLLLSAPPAAHAPIHHPSVSIIMHHNHAMPSIPSILPFNAYHPPIPNAIPSQSLNAPFFLLQAFLYTENSFLVPPSFLRPSFERSVYKAPILQSPPHSISIQPIHKCNLIPSQTRKFSTQTQAPLTITPSVPRTRDRDRRTRTLAPAPELHIHAKPTRFLP